MIGKLATGVLCQDCEMLVCPSDACYGNRKSKLKVYMLSSVIMVLALFFSQVCEHACVVVANLRSIVTYPMSLHLWPIQELCEMSLSLEKIWIL